MGALLFPVPEVGVEPTCLTAIDLKSIAATNYATRAIAVFVKEALGPLYCYLFQITIEAWGGIEPPYIPFAEECLTTWLPGRTFYLFYKLSAFALILLTAKQFVNFLPVLFSAIYFYVYKRNNLCIQTFL